jgi:hypothetical protein
LQIWMFVLIIFGCLILIGVVIDYIYKRRNLNVDPEEGSKNETGSNRAYTETYLNEMRHNHTDHNDPT